MVNIKNLFAKAQDQASKINSWVQTQQAKQAQSKALFLQARHTVNPRKPDKSKIGIEVSFNLHDAQTLSQPTGHLYTYRWAGKEPIQPGDIVETNTENPGVVVAVDLVEKLAAQKNFPLSSIVTLSKKLSKEQIEFEAAQQIISQIKESLAMALAMESDPKADPREIGKYYWKAYKRAEEVELPNKTVHKLRALGNYWYDYPEGKQKPKAVALSDIKLANNLGNFS